MIQDNYHLPFHTLSSFLRHPSPPIIILLVYLCLPAAVPHLSKGQSPSCTVDRPPSSRHTLLYGASLSSFLPCPIASYKAITLRLHSSCPSVVSFRLSVSVCPSAFQVACIHNPGPCILGGWPLCVEWASFVAKIAPQDSF